MKKTLLGLLFSAALIATSGLTASAADTPQTSNGTVGFTGGDITIDNGDTDLAGASPDFGTNQNTAADSDDYYDNTNNSAPVSVVHILRTTAGWECSVK